MITVKPIKRPFKATVNVPGDKSISHRAVIISSLAESPVEVSNFLAAEDCLSTVNCMRALGADIVRDGDKLLITGQGLHVPDNILDAGNSGTTLRLLMGLLAAQNFLTVFTGDNSLRRRPLARVIKPLSLMGASVFARENNFLPAAVLPAVNKLRGITYHMLVASAQVKSAILLASLFADSPTTIIEPAPSRDHTELMLEAFGVRLERADNSVKIFPADKLIAPEKISVPADISSAAFFIVLASILPDSEIIIPNVGVNPTRTGVVDVLRAMGADIKFLNPRNLTNEPVADLLVRYAPLRAVHVKAEIVPRLIDEIPVLAVAAAFAEGTSHFSGLAELRVKESDRLNAISDEFNKIAPDSFRVEDDSLIIVGQRPKNFAECQSHSDHRIAMALAIFGGAAQGVAIDNPSCVNISFPNFFSMLNPAQ